MCLKMEAKMETFAARLKNARKASVVFPVQMVADDVPESVARSQVPAVEPAIMTNVELA